MVLLTFYMSVHRFYNSQKHAKIKGNKSLWVLDILFFVSHEIFTTGYPFSEYICQSLLSRVSSPRFYRSSSIFYYTSIYLSLLFLSFSTKKEKNILMSLGIFQLMYRKHRPMIVSFSRKVRFLGVDSQIRSYFLRRTLLTSHY